MDWLITGSGNGLYVFSVEPSPEPIPTYCPLNPYGSTAMKFMANYCNHLSRICIWKYRLQDAMSAILSCPECNNRLLGSSVASIFRPIKSIARSYGNHVADCCQDITMRRIYACPSPQPNLREDSRGERTDWTIFLGCLSNFAIVVCCASCPWWWCDITQTHIVMSFWWITFRMSQRTWKLVSCFITIIRIIIIH